MCKVPGLWNEFYLRECYESNFSQHTLANVLVLSSVVSLRVADGLFNFTYLLEVQHSCPLPYYQFAVLYIYRGDISA